jgi:hypothetical protein
LGFDGVTIGDKTIPFDRGEKGVICLLGIPKQASSSGKANRIRLKAELVCGNDRPLKKFIPLLSICLIKDGGTLNRNNFGILTEMSSEYRSLFLFARGD